MLIYNVEEEMGYPISLNFTMNHYLRYLHEQRKDMYKKFVLVRVVRGRNFPCF